MNNSAVGDAGDITITTGEITLNNNSELNNTSFARGDAGDIIVAEFSWMAAVDLVVM